MDEKSTAARHTVRGCLVAAGAFLLIDFFLRSISLGRGGYLELLVLPLALGFVMGVLVGSRWQRPILASLLLSAALVLAEAIPYTIDTVAMVNKSDESYASMQREHPLYVRRTPSELRALAVKGRVISFLMLAPLLIGGLTTMGAMAGRRLGRG